MSDVSIVTLEEGWSAMAWTNISEFGVHLFKIEAKVTILSIDQNSVELVIEQNQIADEQTTP